MQPLFRIIQIKQFLQETLCRLNFHSDSTRKMRYCLIFSISQYSKHESKDFYILSAKPSSYRKNLCCAKVNEYVTVYVFHVFVIQLSEKSDPKFESLCKKRRLKLRQTLCHLSLLLLPDSFFFFCS